jgi:hypothetical protein
MFFDVSFQRDKTLVDEVSDFLIRVRLSFQLSTRASSRRGGKINQQRFLLSFGLGERRVHVFDPIDKHGSPSF